MNILKSRPVKKVNYIDGFYPDLKIEDFSLYFFCKVYDVIDFQPSLDELDDEYAGDLYELLFPKEDIDLINKDKFKHHWEEYKPELKVICDSLMEKYFSKTNPIEEFVNSKSAKSLQKLFNFTEFDCIVLIMLLYNREVAWMNLTKSAETLLDCVVAVTGLSKEECLNQLNGKWNDCVDTSFVVNGIGHYLFYDYLFKTDKKILVTNGYDFSFEEYSIEHISKEFQPAEILLKGIFDLCERKNSGCLISLKCESEGVNKNFILQLANKINKKVLYLDIDKDNPNEEKIRFALIMISAQVNPKDTILVCSNKLSRILLSAKDDDPFDLDMSSNDKTDGIELFDYIAASTICLLKSTSLDGVKISEEVKSKLILDTTMELPGNADYTTQLEALAKTKNFSEKNINLINDAIEHASNPDSYMWNYVKRNVENLGEYVPDSVSELIAGQLNKACTTGLKLRKLENYDLSVLKTSLPVDKLVTSIKNAEKLQKGQYDADSGIHILMYGKSGTGKTAFAEYIAHLLNKPLHYVLASDILSRDVGAIENNIKTNFEEAAKNHEILLIDEADSLLTSRQNAKMSWEISQANEFLVQIERFPGILFCCTNFRSSLDTALNRRFHMQIEFKELDREGVEKLFKVYFPQFTFTEEQINSVFNICYITPGDFGTLQGRIRFSDPDKVDGDFIISEFTDILNSKDSLENEKPIGFNV